MRGHPPMDQRGLTLIELMIAVIVVAGLIAMMVPSVQAVAGVKVRETSGKLAGAIGYLYSHTAITGRTCRLVFKLPADAQDSGGYAAECTEGSPRLSTEPIEVREGAMELPPPSAWEDGTPIRDDEQFEAQIKQSAQWAQFAGRTLQPVSLPAGVRLAGVWTGRLEEPITQGDAYLYFFPLGETQHAYVWLTDTNDNAYTLVVQALTGKVKVYNENLEVPRD